MFCLIRISNEEGFKDNNSLKQTQSFVRVCVHHFLQIVNNMDKNYNN